MPLESSNRFSLKQSHVPVITSSAAGYQFREEERTQQNHHDEAACTTFPRTIADRSWRGWTRMVKAPSIEPSFAGASQRIGYDNGCSLQGVRLGPLPESLHFCGRLKMR
jgi:hypothetical protein